MLKFAAPLALIAAIALPGLASAAEKGKDLPPDFFQKQVWPILEEKCVDCHGPKKQKHKFRLDSREAMILGGKDGSAMTPGDPEKSPMIVALHRKDEDTAMPPDEEDKLDEKQIAILTAWVAAGAPWPAGAGPK